MQGLRIAVVATIMALSSPVSAQQPPAASLPPPDFSKVEVRTTDLGRHATCSKATAATSRSPWRGRHHHGRRPVRSRARQDQGRDRSDVDTAGQISDQYASSRRPHRRQCRPSPRMAPPLSAPRSMQRIFLRPAPAMDDRHEDTGRAARGCRRTPMTRNVARSGLMAAPPSSRIPPMRTPTATPMSGSRPPMCCRPATPSPMPAAIPTSTGSMAATSGGMIAAPVPPI